MTGTYKLEKNGVKNCSPEKSNNAINQTNTNVRSLSWNGMTIFAECLNTNDLSPPNVKSIRTQPAVVDDRTEFRPSLRQPPVFHPNDDFESWEFAVTIYLASVSEKSMGPYILSFLGEEAARMFRSTGVRPTAPAPVIWPDAHIPDNSRDGCQSGSSLLERTLVPLQVAVQLLPLHCRQRLVAHLMDYLRPALLWIAVRRVYDNPGLNSLVGAHYQLSHH
ncbi:hypothetical protein EG68_12128 [Paragonimus skrjabini miyazakii]|uniref:Uncharacterized protein n=1 Tax=Paragonimus skrjabini miyazakii TaxID=59628 RepID=A0A8S9YI33_9TREM|nr:hypothetical protein EG68_12128 [Paragonimus skrjabini miyazakii]